MRKLIFYLFLLIPVLGFGQQKLQKVRVTPQWTPQSQFAGIYMAKEKGFYEEAGLDVEIIHPSAAISSVNLLTSGKTDIITSQLIEAMLYKDSGVDLINFLQTAEHNSLIILSREPYDDISGLNNKKIGRWSAGFSELGMALINGYGLDVEWIPFFSNIALYISGAIDATLCMGYNEFFQLKMSGTPITEKQVFKFKDLGYDVQEDGFYTLASFYEANSDLLRRFAEATKKGWDWTRKLENEEETIDYIMSLVEKYHIPSNRINQTFMLEEILRLQENEKGEVPYFISKERFDFAVKLMLDNNFIFNTIDYEEFIKTL